MEIVQHRIVNKGALIATFSLKFKTECGNLISRKMSHFKKGAQEWISFGSELYEKEGVKKYFQFCMFEENTEGQIFQQDVIQLLADYVESNSPAGQSLPGWPSEGNASLKASAPIPKLDPQEAFVF